ncbi:hypothetical protein B0H14DRAFT_3174327 [Mycena olivaceomarginata]|nr:hypothetical protein B0H14DRAFT_3174327 [Mycena olivaceomarginata]
MCLGRRSKRRREAIRRSESPLPTSAFSTSSSSPRAFTSNALLPSPTTNRTSGVIALDFGAATRAFASDASSPSPTTDRTSGGTDTIALGLQAVTRAFTSGVSSPSPTTDRTSGGTEAIALGLQAETRAFMSGASSPSPTIDRDTIAVGLGASLGAATRAFTGAPSPSPTEERDTIAVGLGASLGAAMHLIYDYYRQATEPEAAQSSNNAHEERNSGSQGTVPICRSPSPASAFNAIFFVAESHHLQCFVAVANYKSSSSPRSSTSSASYYTITSTGTNSQVSIQPRSGDVPEAIRRSPSPPSTLNASSSSPRAITSSTSSLSPTTNRTSGVIPAQSSNNVHEERNSGFQIRRSTSQASTFNAKSSSPGPSTSSATSPSPTTDGPSGTIAGAIALGLGTAMYLYYNSRRTRSDVLALVGLKAMALTGFGPALA